MRPRHLVLAALLAAASMASVAKAETSNGNDFALYYSEAKTPAERSKLLEEHKGRPHLFRYLQVMEIEEKNGRAFDITAFEPSSLMDVRFVVTKTESLKKLREEPATKRGDAVALTGVVMGIASNTIFLNPVIIRHKDILTPKRGKEMLYEVDASATFYSFTGGERPVSLTYQDRDLLQYEAQIKARDGKKGWAEFLEREVAKRKAERAAAAKARTAAEPKP